MGLMDRLRKQQAKHGRRQVNLGQIGDRVLDVGDAVGSLVRTLRGECPECHSVITVESRESTTVVSHCSQRVVMR